MPAFDARDEGDLQRLLGRLETEKEANTIDSLTLCISNQHLNLGPTWLWRVLSHRYSKIRDLTVREIDPDALAASGATKQIKLWLQLVQAQYPRSLRLSFSRKDTEKSCPVFFDLRDALQYPSNRVTTLQVQGAPSVLRIHEQFVLPVLQHANNELRELSLKDLYDISDNEAKALSLALASPTCNVDMLDLDVIDPSLNGALCILEGLEMSRCLRQLNWYTARLDKCKTDIAIRMARYLGRPGNTLRALTWTVERNNDHVSILAKALTSEHCRLETLDCDFDYFQAVDAAVPLFASLRHPNNRVKSLMVAFRGYQASIELGKSLANPNCKLEWLELGRVYRFEMDPECMTAIADGLSTTLGPSRLRKLYIWGSQPSAMFSILARSLRSRQNNVIDLRVEGSERMDEATRDDFHRALRKSNVAFFGNPNPYGQASSFCKAFNNPVSGVLRTLLSIKFVPRLGAGASIKVLPLHDFIVMIAETLGWQPDVL